MHSQIQQNFREPLLWISTSACSSEQRDQHWAITIKARVGTQWEKDEKENSQEASGKCGWGKVQAGMGQEGRLLPESIWKMRGGCYPMEENKLFCLTTPTPPPKKTTQEAKGRHCWVQEKEGLGWHRQQEHLRRKPHHTVPGSLQKDLECSLRAAKPLAKWFEEEEWPAPDCVVMGAFWLQQWTHWEFKWGIHIILGLAYLLLYPLDFFYTHIIAVL